MEALRKISHALWDILESATFALALVVVANLFLFMPSKVFGSSSYPNLKSGETLITEKVTYRISKPQRGDIVVVESPRNPEVDYIKRIIGLPNETIRLSNGKVQINGSELDESAYLPNTTHTAQEAFLKENQNYVIPEDSYFVMGDNRSHSSDSRDFGPVKFEKIRGRAIFRIWPPEEFGFLHRNDR